MYTSPVSGSDFACDAERGPVSSGWRIPWVARARGSRVEGWSCLYVELSVLAVRVLTPLDVFSFSLALEIDDEDGESSPGMLIESVTPVLIKEGLSWRGSYVDWTFEYIASHGSGLNPPKLNLSPKEPVSCAYSIMSSVEKRELYNTRMDESGLSGGTSWNR